MGMFQFSSGVCILSSFLYSWCCLFCLFVHKIFILVANACWFDVCSLSLVSSILVCVEIWVLKLSFWRNGFASISRWLMFLACFKIMSSCRCWWRWRCHLLMLGHFLWIFFWVITTCTSYFTVSLMLFLQCLFPFCTCNICLLSIWLVTIFMPLFNRLDVYIYDYLLKRKLHASAKAFQAEGKVSTDPVGMIVL